VPACFAPWAGSTHFRRIDAPARGDWLDEHNERGQGFVSFTRSCMRVRPHAHVRVIEMVPVGPFEALGEDGGAAALGVLRRYVCAFFDLPCRLASPLPLSDARVADRARCGDEGQLQLDAGAVTDALRSRRAARDVVCRIAVTLADLYITKDGEAWNFVYGQASLMDGCGVFSLSRYHPRGHPVRHARAGGPATAVAAGPSEQLVPAALRQQLSAAELSLMLQRGAKVLAHELTHMFGVRHCVHYECLMCGCNHMAEFDKRPLFLCPIDLRKLQSAVGFDVRERYERLEALCRELGWHDSAAWLQQRLQPADNACTDPQVE